MPENFLLYAVECYNINLLCKMVYAKSIMYIAYNFSEHVDDDTIFLISYFVFLLVFGINRNFTVENVLDKFCCN